MGNAFCTFQRDYVHITEYIILRDDVIMRLYILLDFVSGLIFFCIKPQSFDLCFHINFSEVD